MTDPYEWQYGNMAHFVTFFPAKYVVILLERSGD